MKFPKHDAGMFITHNEHKNYYENIEEFIINNDIKEFISEEDKQKCIDNNDIWEIQWYPNTPIGFYKIAGSDFNLLLKEIENQNEI